MKKSVYSIVLMDDVIKAVDRKAYQLGTSRSNLINQILAEQLSCITPEMRMHEIFGSLENLLSQNFQIQQCRSDSLLTLRTALEYKYRPTINYKVELVRAPGDYIGSLRVKIRTQSASLIALFNSFFVYWIEFEANLLKHSGINTYSCNLSSDCFTRQLLHFKQRSDEQNGAAICSYITLLDKAIKLYFEAPNAFSAAAAELEYEYARQLEHTII